MPEMISNTTLKPKDTAIVEIEPRQNSEQTTISSKSLNPLAVVNNYDQNINWLVVLGSFNVHFVLFGLFYSFGIYIPTYKMMNLGSNSQISVIGGLGIGVMNLFGIVSGKIADRIGFRNSVMTGSIIMTISLIIASFGSELWHFVLFQGTFMGIGASLAYTPSLAAPSLWFDKKRGLATGLAVAGSGLGGFIMTLVLRTLLDTYGLAWSFRISAILVFVVIFGSSFLIKSPHDSLSKSQKEASSKPFPFHLLKNTVFLFMFAMTFFGSFGYLVPVIFIPQYAVSALSTTPSQGALALSLFSASSTLGRIIMGIIADKFGRFRILNISLILSSFAILVIWNLASTFPILILFAVVYGFMAGGLISLIPVVIADVFGRDTLATVLGLLYSATSLGSVAGGPLAGVILDWNTDSSTGAVYWLPAILFGGGLFMVGAIMGCMSIFIYNRESKKIG